MERGGLYIIPKQSNLAGGEVVEIWLGPPSDPESEFLMSIDECYLDDLIALLKLWKQKKKG